MIKIEELETSGWEAAFRGMRNPLNSWDKGDSRWVDIGITKEEYQRKYQLGQNDFDLACRLIKAGPEHRKFLRMIHVQFDVTAPLFWWKEFDTYKVGTTANSCSTMHKIMAKEFTFDDFSYDAVPFGEKECKSDTITGQEVFSVARNTINTLNLLRDKYIETKDRMYWRWLIELLPSSYNQKRTWDGSMETVLSVEHQRDHHKLKEEWEPFRTALFDGVPYLKEFYKALHGEKETVNDWTKN